jgi:hypothetical protein
VLTAVSAALVIGDPGEVARTAVAAETGVEALARPVALSVWPSVAAAVGLVVLAAAGWLAATSGRWARPSARHDLVAEDRTTDGTTGGTAKVTADGTADGTTAPDDDRAAWDALSRGQDPT